MNKYELSIDGMRCGMCEIHVEEMVEKLTKEDFEKAFVESGYRVLSFKKEKAIKKLFGWR